MPKIVNHSQFTQSLLENKPVVLKNNGTWYIENKLVHYVKCLFGWETTRLLNITRIVTKCFYELEKEEVILDDATKRVIKSFDYKPWIADYVAIEGVLSKLKQSDTVVKSRMQLKAYKIGLEYRLNINPPGLEYLKESEISQPKLQLLIQIARNWKREQRYFENQELTPKNLEKIKELCRYPEFYSLLVAPIPGANKEHLAKFRDDVFNWVFRNRNQDDSLVKFPGHAKRLRDCFLASRIEDEKHKQPALKVCYRPTSEEGNVRLDLTLPIGLNDEVSILDESQVINFRGNIKMTIKEVLENQFAEKDEVNGKLEFLDHWGPEKKPKIELYDSHEWGYRDSEGVFHSDVNFDSPDWYLQLPFCGIMTLDEAKETFELPFVWDEWVSLTRQQFPGQATWINWLNEWNESPMRWEKMIEAAKTEFGDVGQDFVDWINESRVRYAPG